VRAAILACIVLGLPAAAHADLQVRSPLVEYRELEFEHNGFSGLDRKRSPFNGLQSYTYSVGYGLLPFWKIELEAETGVVAGANQGYAATTLENIFQLTQEGRYFVDLGVFAEYSRSSLAGVPGSFTAGPIVQTELDDVAGIDSLHTLNLFLSRDVGRSHTDDSGLSYAARSELLFRPLLDPGIEAFGSIGSITHAARYSDQQHSVGPVLTGAYLIAPYGKIKYEAGYQFGLTGRTARGGARWKFEYEIAF